MTKVADQKKAADEKTAEKIPPTNTEEKQTKAPITDYTALTVYKATHEEIAVIKRTVCKDLNDAEFIMFLNVCHAVQLHPLLKQIWVFKRKDWIDRNKVSHRGEVIMFTGRDGNFVVAERHPDYRGYKSAAVYENDFFEVDWNDHNDPVKHRAKGIERGPLIGAYAVCYRKDCPPAIAITKLRDFSKRKPAKSEKAQNERIEDDEKKGRDSAWDTNEMDMIIIRAEAKAFKKQFPASGVQSEYDWKKNEDGTVSPINKNEFIKEEDQESLHLEAMENLLALWKDCKSKDRNYYKTMILKEREAGNLTFERIKYWEEVLTTPDKVREEETPAE